MQSDKTASSDVTQWLSFTVGNVGNIAPTFALNMDSFKSELRYHLFLIHTYFFLLPTLPTMHLSHTGVTLSDYTQPTSRVTKDLILLF